MKVIRKRVTGVIAGALLMLSCVDPYQPPAVSGDVDILVVDGFINAADGSAKVTISRAHVLSSDSVPTPELNAVVTIRSGSDNYLLPPQGITGSYVVSGINITPGSSYQLLIRTTDQQDYISDEVQAKQTPPIDSITWAANGDKGVFIQVNTHDNTGNSRYYRWDFIETYQYNAAISSDYKVVDDRIEPRDLDERLYMCWRTDSSKVISVATSSRLVEDVISRQPLTFLFRGSNHLRMKYSILVKQRTISKEEYTFLDQLKKSTESLGGLFDPMPSQVTGNVRGVTDPSAPVLGYFSAGTTQEKRFFLDRSELPDQLQQYTVMSNCQPDTLELWQLGGLSSANIIASAIYEEGRLVGYTLSNPRCADCRYQGGITTEPDFWP